MMPSPSNRAGCCVCLFVVDFCIVLLPLGAQFFHCSFNCWLANIIHAGANETKKTI